MYEVKVQGETGTQAAHSAVEINIYWGLERVLLIKESQSPRCVGSIPAKRMAQSMVSYSVVGSFSGCIFHPVTRSKCRGYQAQKPSSVHARRRTRSLARTRCWIWL
jgi:hypothetical protein